MVLKFCEALLVYLESLQHINFNIGASHDVHKYIENASALINNSLAPSTRRSYNSALRKLDQFSYAINDPINLEKGISHQLLLVFIGYLWDKSYAPATLKVYLAAVSYIQGVLDAPDPTKSFLVQKAVKGFTNGDRRADSRQPISYTLLKNIIAKLDTVCTDLYEAMLFKAVFLLAWSAMLRVSEYTTRNLTTFSHCLQNSFVDTFDDIVS